MTASRTIVRVLGGKLSLSIARARLALELRSVAYELMDEPLEPRKSDRLLTANPAYGKIPVLLLLDGFAICESVVIVQYVEDVAQAGGGAGGEGEAAALLLPEDPYERAMHRFWTAYIDDRVITSTTISDSTSGDTCSPAMACVLWKLWLAIDAVSLGPTSETHVQATGDARAALRLLEGAFTDCSSGVGFFSGSDVVPGFLDLALGYFLSALRACGRHHGLSLSTRPPRR
ncbi:probable glutathione S-transferase BZ2 [Setaria italica]|uniref:probable glutathione S-transferase BZ2 n=1 Tax=Setaria italica TaxID=4555 RepID=UPI000BE5B3B2|nr:probable glutathione S-transferase BZ2 [Setaria italica]